MANPVLVEVTRGPLVESRHRGSVVVCDARGALVLALGDVDQPVFPRSAVKAFQALPLIETGAADKLGLTPAEIALACASHAGEPGHTVAAAGMLAKAGRDVGCLECGTHWPNDENAARALAAKGLEPSALHNNCSGKHSGFVCLSCAEGVDPRGYVGADHPVQQAVKAAVEAMTGTALGADVCGTDGCSIPTYAVPLSAMARGFARFGTGEGLSADRAAACARIRTCVAAHPWNVGGTVKLDTIVMQRLGDRVFMKTGAEGVYCAALPQQGLGIALKCDDGATRASQAMFCAVLQRFLPMSDAEKADLSPYFQPALTNWNGIRFGEVRAAPFQN
jgi:L-asparaginase II